ncbi:caleosin domain-containing protein, partial [Sparassis latifolia]
DSIVWPLDTYRGFHDLGFNILLSVTAMFVIHASFSYATVPGYLPDPFFRLHLKNIHKAKHGSDSGIFDNEGRFIPQKFEDFFSKYADGKDGLTMEDVLKALKGQRLLMDFTGWIGAFFEWLSIYIFLWPEDGMMKKEDIRRVLDGSIFSEAASKRAGRKKTKAT